MSYVVKPYALNLDDIRTAVGSGNTDLKSAIAQSNQEEFEEDAQQNTDSISLRQAVEELIDGQLSMPRLGHRYGYALEPICDHFGEMLESDWWSAVRWEAIELAGLDGVFEQSGPPVTVPPIADFPVIAHIANARAEEILADSSGSAFSSQDSDVQELLDEYRGWLRHASDRGKDLVLFYY